MNAFIRIKHLNDDAYTSSHNLIFCTKRGVIKKTSLKAYSRPRANGVNAIVIREGDCLLQVRLTDGDSEVVMANRKGRAIRFHESKVREMGRVSTGVKGMTLDGEDDEIIGMVTFKASGKNSIANMEHSASVFDENEGVDNETLEIETEVIDVETPDADNLNEEEIDEENRPETIMVVSSKGYGKRSAISGYRVTNRGGKGVKTLNITDKTGDLVAIQIVTDENDLMIINQSGITLRLPVAGIRVMGRYTQGVKLIELSKRGETIASVCKVDSDPEKEIEEETEGEPLAQEEEGVVNDAPAVEEEPETQE